MARIGFAVAAVLALSGLVLMVLGYSSPPRAELAMYFIAGAVLLGCAGISASIAGLAAERPVSQVAEREQTARSEPRMSYPDPFRPAAASPAAPVVAEAAAVTAAAAATVAVVIPETLPEQDMPAAEPVHEHPSPPPVEAVIAEAAPPRMPDAAAMFELPPLKPSLALEPEPAALVEPAAPVITATIEETEIEVQPASEALTPALPPEPVADVSPEPDVAAMPEPAPPAAVEVDDDLFDLEAAIAAELGIAEPQEHQALAEVQPEAIEPIAADPLPEPEPVIEHTAPAMPKAQPAFAPLPDELAETPMEPEPAPAPVMPEGVVVGSYESGGVLYTLYEDGSVTAEAGGVIEKYESLDALRAAFDNSPA